MRVTHLKSATVLIEHAGVRVLCDPWLTDGEYYGAWHHVPPFRFRAQDFADVDYIYVSHIHPDHVSRRTMEQLDRRTPVLIHRYASQFLKGYLERLGFPVRELPHGERTYLGGDLHINIIAADNCDPSVCGRFFGCAKMESAVGSTQIDTLSVIDDGRHCVVNVNDCSWALAQRALERVWRQYPRVDLLLVGYSGAGPYPQCFTSLPIDARRAAAAAKKLSFLMQAEQYIEALRPRWYMPFAGTYALGGRLAPLNDLRGVPELSEAASWLEASSAVRATGARGVLLDPWGSFDLEHECLSGPYTPPDPHAKSAYVRDILAHRQLDYEDDPQPSLAELLDLLPAAYARLETKRAEIGFRSVVTLIVPLTDGTSACISLAGEGWRRRDDGSAYSQDPPGERPALAAHAGDGRPASQSLSQHDPPYLCVRTDPRLLKRLLSGPKHAHWNNAEIGSHLEFARQPDVFERGLHHVLSYFHA
jgi:UDP-MurNAc hydroxylase